MKAISSIILEVEKEDRRYRMEIPVNSPLGEAYESCHVFMKEIVRLINENSKKMAETSKPKKGEKDANTSSN